MKTHSNLRAHCYHSEVLRGITQLLAAEIIRKLKVEVQVWISCSLSLDFIGIFLSGEINVSENEIPID
jgi:hypothetical protein